MTRKLRVHVYPLLIGLAICSAQLIYSQYQWTTPVPIDSSTSGMQLGGFMAVADNDNILVTWSGFLTNGIGNVIQRSTDRGVSWMRSEDVGTELSRTPRDIVVDHYGNVWLLWISIDNAFAPYFLNLSKSTDSGQTFTTVFRSRAYANGFFQQKLAVDGNNSIYMLWDDLQFKLTKFKNGDTSQRTDAVMPTDTFTVATNSWISISDDFTVHCVWGGIRQISSGAYREFVFYSPSRDTGTTISGRTRIDTVEEAAPSLIQEVPSLAADNSNSVYVSYTWRSSSGNSEIRLARSTDGGSSFLSPVVLSGEDTAYSSILCKDSLGGVNVVWTSRSGTWHKRTTEGGSTFSTAVAIGWISPRSVRSSGTNYLYASGEGGLYVAFTKTNLATGVLEIPEIASKFELLQNYPNPFNPVTTIGFRIQESGYVTLKVYDVLGRAVATLVDEKRPAGEHSVQWNATGLSSGVYICRMQAGKFTETRKLLLMK